jgi:hypothetical protein
MRPSLRRLGARLPAAVLLGVGIAALVLWCLLPRGIGTLRMRQGQVERDRARHEERWETAHVGDVFAIGDGLRTAAQASAEVKIEAGPLLKVKPSTVLRFRGRAAESAQVSLSQGEVSIFTAEDPVLFETAAGILRVAPYSRTVLRRDARETRLEVVFGRAELQWESANARILTAGQLAVFVEASGRTLFPMDLRASARDSDKSETRDAGADRPVTDVKAPPSSEVGGDLPAQNHVSMVDVILSPEASVTVLDGWPPTQIGFVRQASCPERTELAIERGGRFVPTGASSYAFPVGPTRYRLTCGARQVAGGVVRVIKDPGHQKLVAPGPANVVDADGRTYSVLYQTAFPEIRVRWPSMAADTVSTLFIQGSAGVRQFNVKGNQFVLPPASLSEGEQQLWFEQADSNRRSRTTKLSLRFDNATPLARLNENNFVSVDEGGKAHVSGVVVEGAKVVVRGARVPVDGAGRFEASVARAPGERGFVIAVSVPRRGVFHYVRRFQTVEPSP